RRANGGFALHLEDGRVVTSRQVVLAAGHMAFHVMPPELSGLPEPQGVHRARMGAVERYAGRDVTVIGAGQSALESAALLHEAGARVRVIVRGDRLLWNEPSRRRSLLERIRMPDAGIASGWRSVAISELPRTFRWLFPPAKRHRFVASAYGPSGAWWLRDRFVDQIEVWLDSRIEMASMVGDRVRLRVARAEGVQECVTDYVIAGTGFRVDVNRLDYLDRSLIADLRTEAEGIPALSPRFETSIPGLYMAGIATSPVFGPIMRFMYGAKHAAPIIAQALR
ncbi:MAG TPA: NAD(P)-binding domain-containing protein, partial [Steroidobacteraceae bacterium]|nr:NAD(P)-binding domain-containing protein [Steroidobacteraceae bacterium]